jgi:hypothetical protein
LRSGFADRLVHDFRPHGIRWGQHGTTKKVEMLKRLDFARTANASASSPCSDNCAANRLIEVE